MKTTNELTIGLDPGDRRHHVCVLSASGEILHEEMISNTRECLATFAARYPSATFILETGTHSPWVSRLLEQRGHPVIVANARKLRAISASHTKNDAKDCAHACATRSRGRGSAQPDGPRHYCFLAYPIRNARGMVDGLITLGFEAPLPKRPTRR